MLALEGLSVELQRAFDRQMALCDLLETIADSLPGGVDRQQCLHTARVIGSLIRQGHRTEEAILFPQLSAGQGDADDVVERLRLEHIEDECLAEEVQYELLQLGSGKPDLCPEATRSMLRGFFQGLRRRVRYEHELFSGMTGITAQPARTA